MRKQFIVPAYFIKSSTSKVNEVASSIKRIIPDAVRKHPENLVPEDPKSRIVLGEYLFRGSRFAKPYQGGYFDETILHGSPHKFVAELYGRDPYNKLHGSIVHKFKTRPLQPLGPDYSIDMSIHDTKKQPLKRFNIGDDISDYQNTWETPINKSKHLYSGTLFSDHLGNTTLIPPGDFNSRKRFTQFVDNMNEGMPTKNRMGNRNPNLILRSIFKNKTISPEDPNYKEEVLKRITRAGY